MDDKAQQCWICGGKDHRKKECKLRSQTKFSAKDGKGQGEPAGGSGGGKGAGGGSSSSGKVPQLPQKPSTSSTTPAVKELEVSPETSYAGQGMEGNAVEAKGGGETGSTSTTSEALLQEATKLLKSLRAPQLKVIKVSQLEHDPSGQLVLLDSGATPALRPARDQDEWEQATPTQVTLADGVTTKLRLEVGTKVLLAAPDDGGFGQSWIVPLGGVAELGYKFEWKGAQCGLGMIRVETWRWWSSMDALWCREAWARR